ncbi:MAG: BtrH N-terminal domain-containing protein, partial [Parahaliea sp.]
MDSFEHRQTAHCESGTVAALLRHNGLDLSEPMVFGLSCALTFAYIPMVKINGQPLLAYRMPPGRIIKGLAKRLGVGFEFQRFRDPAQGQRALDLHLSESRPVGLQTSVYWLPYFPPNMRFHFNAHNIVAVHRDQQDVLVSDPTFETLQRVDDAALSRARFVKGLLAPRGLLYYPKTIPDHIDYPRVIPAAIRSTCRMMLHTPLPFFGVRGIRYVARKIRRLKPQQAHANSLFLGHLVRMQEEIGTGGAGFRFLFSSFLQESADILGAGELAQAAENVSLAGDDWRRFALYTAKMLKGREPLDY